MWIIAVILVVPAVATLCAIIVGGRYDKRDDYNQGGQYDT